MKKYWPLTLPFLFFGTFYFLLRVKPKLDMYVLEQNYRKEILQSGSADVISCGHHNWPDPDVNIGQIKGDNLKDLLTNIHLRPVPDRRIFNAYDTYTTYFLIQSSQKPTLKMLLIGECGDISSTSRPPYFSGLLSNFYRYELTPESGRALKQFIAQHHFGKSPKAK